MIQLRDLEKSHITKAGCTWALRQIDLTIVQVTHIPDWAQHGHRIATLNDGWMKKP